MRLRGPPRRWSRGPRGTAGASWPVPNYIYIYIYIERERERCVYIICTIYIYIYIHIYIIYNDNV